MREFIKRHKEDTALMWREYMKTISKNNAIIVEKIKWKEEERVPGEEMVKYIYEEEAQKR